MMTLFLITLVLLGIAVGGISIKLWAKKDGEFAGTCASQNPMINKDGEACGFCGKTPDEYKDCSEPEHA
jgi:hypothetical protein|tara:strand:+ start:220 stop:426 length:207 start_codon:yes stop_codon:yes gene_type:complete